MEKRGARFGNIKEMLSRDQMKQIRGGLTGYKCCTSCAGGSPNGCGSCQSGSSCSNGQNACADSTCR